MSTPSPATTNRTGSGQSPQIWTNPNNNRPEFSQPDRKHLKKAEKAETRFPAIDGRSSLNHPRKKKSHRKAETAHDHNTRLDRTQRRLCEQARAFVHIDKGQYGASLKLIPGSVIPALRCGNLAVCRTDARSCRNLLARDRSTRAWAPCCTPRDTRGGARV